VEVEAATTLHMVSSAGTLCSGAMLRIIYLKFKKISDAHHQQETETLKPSTTTTFSTVLYKYCTVKSSIYFLSGAHD
jgi:hypothetical protein